jgi:signal transduction histidine kinase
LLGRETSVTTELAENLPQVEGDEVQLQQVLLNLVINAIEAMQTIPLEKRHILITSRTEIDGSVGITVRDHGVGLPREDPNQVFTHFYSTKANGMGMGLTIGRSIVERHGGVLGTERVNQGAQFVIRLPCMSATQKPRQAT